MSIILTVALGVSCLTLGFVCGVVLAMAAVVEASDQ